jgi:hypothetical protein
MMTDVLSGMEPQPSGEAFLKTAASLVSCLPQASIGRSALLAVMCASQTHQNVRRYIPSLGKKLFTKSRDDAGFMALGHELKVLPPTLQRYDKAVVEDAVHHILKNTAQDSWGSTEYHLPGLVTAVTSHDGEALWCPGQEKMVTMPCLRRECGIVDSWRGYFQSRQHGADHLGETAFTQLLHVVTASQMKARAGVNYVEGQHLHDPLAKVELIAKGVRGWDSKLMLGGLRYFLKTEYLHRHAGKGECCSHSDRHSLFCEPADDADACDACQLPFLVLADLKRVAADDYAEVLDDCGEHFKTYMAYQLRVANARRGMKIREEEQGPDDVREQMDYMVLHSFLPVPPFIPTHALLSSFLPHYRR